MPVKSVGAQLPAELLPGKVAVMSDDFDDNDISAQGTKPIRSQYVYARKMGSTDTVMVTVDEAQRRGYLVFDYESRTYRPLDTVPPGVLKIRARTRFSEELTGPGATAAPDPLP